MNDAALQSYIDKWLAAEPAQRIALAFAGAQREPGAALAALQREWIAAAHGIGEPQVAAAKLHWWAGELAGAGASGGRHPLTRALFATGNGRRLPAECWLAPVLAALAGLEVGTPADFAGQLRQAEAFHGALAALETAWWFGAAADSTRAARMATLGHVLRATAQLGRDASGERLPLPMARLARHGLDRDSLRHDSPARRDALRAQATDLAAAWRRAWQLPGPLTPLRGLEARLGERLARRVARAAQPLAVLQAGLARTGGPGTVLRAWSAARAWQRALAAA
ncbi:MAG TPA: squalene/phytoene synthase family protein [Rhodanobacteraceae bacterium]|nr:squalene/phytoene synthase family protein [Rhodanobacteraceae bacterium]